MWVVVGRERDVCTTYPLIKLYNSFYIRDDYKRYGQLVGMNIETPAWVIRQTSILNN